MLCNGTSKQPEVRAASPAAQVVNKQNIFTARWHTRRLSGPMGYAMPGEVFQIF